MVIPFLMFVIAGSLTVAFIAQATDTIDCNGQMQLGLLLLDLLLLDT